jgi:hypothetical protein
MSVRLSRRGLADIVHTAFGASLPAVFSMSRANHPSDVPEYFFTVKIAEALSANLAGERIVKMECSAATILNGANALQRGPKSDDMRLAGRADIAIYNRNDQTPEASIEVKRHVYGACAGPEADIRRLTSLLAHGADRSSLVFGVFTFCTFIYDGDPEGRKELIRARLADYHQTSDRRNCLSVSTDFREVRGLRCDAHVLTGVTIIQRV